VLEVQLPADAALPPLAAAIAVGTPVGPQLAADAAVAATAAAEAAAAAAAAAAALPPAPTNGVARLSGERRTASGRARSSSIRAAAAAAPARPNSAPPTLPLHGIVRSSSGGVSSGGVGGSMLRKAISDATAAAEQAAADDGRNGAAGAAAAARPAKRARLSLSSGPHQHAVSQPDLRGMGLPAPGFPPGLATASFAPPPTAQLPSRLAGQQALGAAFTASAAAARAATAADGAFNLAGLPALQGRPLEGEAAQHWAPPAVEIRTLCAGDAADCASAAAAANEADVAMPDAESPPARDSDSDPDWPPRQHPAHRRRGATHGATNGEHHLGGMSPAAWALLQRESPQPQEPPAALQSPAAQDPSGPRRGLPPPRLGSNIGDGGVLPACAVLARAHSPVREASPAAGTRPTGGSAEAYAARAQGAAADARSTAALGAAGTACGPAQPQQPARQRRPQLWAGHDAAAGVAPPESAAMATSRVPLPARTDRPRDRGWPPTLLPPAPPRQPGSLGAQPHPRPAQAVLLEPLHAPLVRARAACGAAQQPVAVEASAASWDVAMSHARDAAGQQHGGVRSGNAGEPSVAAAGASPASATVSGELAVRLVADSLGRVALHVSVPEEA